MPNSWDRVLRNASVTGLLSIEAEPETIVVGESVDTAYARGHRDGVTAGRSEAVSRIEGLASSIESAMESTQREIAGLRHTQSEALMSVALDVAEVILGTAPEIDKEAMVQRINTALGEIDDRPLTLFMHPDDVVVLGDSLAERFNLDVAEDGALAPGEARISGPWAEADLTRDAALRALREAIS